VAHDLEAVEAEAADLWRAMLILAYRVAMLGTAKILTSNPQTQMLQFHGSAQSLWAICTILTPLFLLLAVGLAECPL
jgi:hypothetical protein